MNWKLILLLSLFGLAMAIGTVFWIAFDVEPYFWLVALGITAYLIAARAGARFFLHGLMVGLVNSVWVTSAHVVFFDTYIASHPREAAMVAEMGSPRLMMSLLGPVIGLVSGCVIGLVAMGIARLRPVTNPSARTSP